MYFYTQGYQSVSCTNEARGYKLFWHRNENTVGIVGKILGNHITKLSSLYQIDRKKDYNKMFFQHQNWMCELQQAEMFFFLRRHLKSFHLSKSGIVMAWVSNLLLPFLQNKLHNQRGPRCGLSDFMSSLEMHYKKTTSLFCYVSAQIPLNHTVTRRRRVNPACTATVHANVLWALHGMIHPKPPELLQVRGAV